MVKEEVVIVIVKITGRLRDRNRCTGRDRGRSRGICRVKGIDRVGSNSRCTGRGTGKGSGRIKSRIEVLVIEEVFMLDCSKNVEVLVGLVLSSILFRPQPICLDTIEYQKTLSFDTKF